MNWSFLDWRMICMTKEELLARIDEAKTFIRSNEPQDKKDEKLKEIRALVKEFKMSKDLDDFSGDLEDEERDDDKKFPQKRSKIHQDDDPEKEMRSAINTYLHSKGTKQSDKLNFTEDRDLIIPNKLTRDVTPGISKTDVSETVPEQIIYVPQDEVKTVVDLAKFVTRSAVKTGSGKYPMRKRASAKLNKVSELEDNPELAKPNFLPISWSVETRRGAEAISQESIDDAAVDLIPLLSEDANEQKINTTNFDTATVLKTFTEITVKTLDDIKKVDNVGLDQAYTRSLVVTGSFYQWLDTLKDGNGRYLLQDDIQSASGKSLLGMPVFKIDDDLFGAKGEAHAWIGDLKRAVFYADRAQIVARWVEDRIYGQYLQVGTRYDIVKADNNAGFFLTLDAKATSNDSSTVNPTTETTTDGK